MKNVILLLTLFTCINFSTLLFAQPTISSFTPTTGKVGTLVTITGTNLSSPTAFTIGGITSVVVSNTGTTLVGMVMPGASTGVISISTSGGSTSTSTNFTLTSTLYPTTQQGSKLVGTGSTGSGSVQGHSVSLSADGNTAIVGGSGDSSSQVGATWIYTRSGSSWTQQGSKLVGTGATLFSNQGYSVALSADGNTAIVGAYGDNSSIGATWVFIRSGSTWTQQGSKLVGTGYSGTPHQGTSVAVSADGNTFAVGGYADNSNVGAVWIFTRSGSTWSQQGSKLVGTSAIGAAGQGRSVALSADGNTLILGGHLDNTNVGASWVFTRSGSTWSQQTKFVGTGYTGAVYQGLSIALNADGNTAIVGGYYDNTGIGAAWVFTRSSSTWSQQGSKLVGTGYSGTAWQGTSVGLSADGNTAVVGGDNDNSSLGAVWVYNRSGSTWSQQGSKLVGSGSTGTSNEGFSAALSADGNTTIVGGQIDNSNLGAAWVFVSSALTPVKLINFNIAKQDKSILLDWQTASEINNDYFSIERSENNSQFTEIGKVKGHGTTSSVQNYQFTYQTLNDKIQTTNIFYYRLKQVDFDGKFEYSKVISMPFENTNSSFNIYPNPATNEILVNATSTLNEILVEIYDLKGLKLFSSNENPSNTIKINLNGLDAGMYFLLVNNKAMKFVKNN